MLMSGSIVCACTMSTRWRILDNWKLECCFSCKVTQNLLGFSIMSSLHETDTQEGLVGVTFWWPLICTTPDPPEKLSKMKPKYLIKMQIKHLFQYSHSIRPTELWGCLLAYQLKHFRWNCTQNKGLLDLYIHRHSHVDKGTFCFPVPKTPEI